MRENELKFIEKRFYRYSKKQNEEYYGACLDPTHKVPGMAYLKVEGVRESLIYSLHKDRLEFILAKDTYVLDPCFANGYLVWSEKERNRWLVKCAKINNDNPDIPIEPFGVIGRPKSFTSFQCNDRDILLWEERSGKKTRIKMVFVYTDSFSEPMDVTDGSFNAYDPMGIEKDGIIYVSFCGFYLGDYRAMCQKFDANGKKVGETFVLSSAFGSVIHVSICSRSDGGIWYTYTQLEPHNNEAYIQHPLARSQHSFNIQNCPSKLYTGFFIGENISAVLQQHCVNTGKGAGPAYIFEDTDGRPRILLRQYVETLARIEPNDNFFKASDGPLEGVNQKEKCINAKGKNLYPNICLISLTDVGWSKPVDIIPRAHFEAPLSFSIDGNVLKIAFTQDTRHTGWSRNGEWFDDVGQLAVGIAEIKLELSGKPKYDIMPVFLPVYPGNRIEEPKVPKMESDYMHVLGQIHAHSNISVCMRMEDRTPHFNYRFMQDVQHSDFGAITDHDYNMWDIEQLYMRKLAEYYYFPNEFVALPAYEWTGSGARHDGGPFGHVNPLWLEEEGDMPVYCAMNVGGEGCSLTKLWDAYKGKKVVTPPHHTADRNHCYRWDFFDERFVPMVEIFQDFRGSGEQPGVAGVTNYLHTMEGSWVLDGLKQKLKFGFVASADHAGIARAGVLVKELTRSGLYEGFMARRCFATTNQTIRLEFTANGEMMGITVQAENVEFRITVLAAVHVKVVEIVRNGSTEDKINANERYFDYSWSIRKKENGEFWYCRVIFENGEVAWSSPIWIE